jgi:YesN/AraC family two-component response regulator
MLKVIVVDDEKFTREGIITYISKDEEIKVIGCAANGLEAYETCREKRPMLS